ncbi:Asp23/Gls24 family envelope stress response protein [Parafrankia discariae]|uniref:Asp23/Gls24 family envelope stress response protein n=1 Tax=Parafrankia discariae TaxID=365528 RepID=UPI0003A7DB38|nr:Asp23/Gls24 family envelope stress response protein [Parafrankia discariae]
MTTTTRTQGAEMGTAQGPGEGRPGGTGPDRARSADGHRNGTAERSTAPARRASTELVTAQGRTAIADSVVRKIAGVATREVSGVHDLGTGGSRAMGTFRARLPGTSPSVSRGVSVEVGERQAAIDLDVVCEYGVSIVDLSQAVRRNVVDSVEQMTGLEVTEVNIAVDDVYIGEDEPAEAPPRVR